MLVGIHKSAWSRFAPMRYEDILDYNNISYVTLDASEPSFWDQVPKVDLFIYRWAHIDDERQVALTIIPIVEKILNVKCLPNLSTCWCYDDKIREYLLLSMMRFPIIKSWIFWNKTKALDWAEGAEYPLVFKLKGGAGSANVILVEDSTKAKRLIRRIYGRGIKSGHIPGIGATRWKDFSIYKTVHHWGGNVLRKLRGEDISPFWQKNKNYVLFQKFLPNNNFDTRITVIGNRAFAFRRMNRKSDFRSSGSGCISYDMSKIDTEFVKIAFEVSKCMGFQSMAYDFLYDENGQRQFSEISYTFVDKAIYDCPGFWDLELNWHEGHFWPPYCHLVDALSIPDLRQPDLLR
jgi:glutathione synthase/RimK-type ligase-like ATP-grasp enzyme